MTAFLLALQFLTIITLRRELRATAQDMAASRAFYAPVGAILGLLLAGAAWLGRGCLPPLALAALLTALWAGLSRFLHLDGLSDSADALVHMTSRERALEIMKDSRVGAFGLCAVVLVLLIKFAALASLPPQRLLAGLLILPVLARSLASLLAVLLPPARAQGLGSSVAGRFGLGRETWGACAALALAGLAGGRAGLAAALAVMLCGLVLGRWYMRRLGGFTGDSLGAAIEVSETAGLLVLTAF